MVQPHKRPVVKVVRSLCRKHGANVSILLFFRAVCLIFISGQYWSRNMDWEAFLAFYYLKEGLKYRQDLECGRPQLSKCLNKHQDSPMAHSTWDKIGPVQCISCGLAIKYRRLLDQISVCFFFPRELFVGDMHFLFHLSRRFMRPDYLFFFFAIKSHWWVEMAQVESR